MRIFCLRAVVAVALVGSVAAAAEQPEKTARVGFVSSTGDPKAPGPLAEAFREKLRELGRVEGKNLRVEYRFAQGKLDRVPGFVDELVKLKVDALVVSSVPAIRAAKRATATVPVVMVISVDPVAIGIVQSLDRPGGNITGLVSLNRDLRKQALDFLKAAVPDLTRVGVLWNSDGRASATPLREYEAAAAPKRIQLQSLEVRGSAPDLEGAFQAAAKGRAGAVVVVGNAALARDELPPGSPAEAMLRRIETAARRGSDLTRQMLAYAGQRDLGRREAVDIGELVGELRTLLGMTGEHRDRVGTTGEFKPGVTITGEYRDDGD